MSAYAAVLFFSVVYFAGFALFTAVAMKNAVSWSVASCGFVIN
jgi:hypothetical protein